MPVLPTAEMLVFDAAPVFSNLHGSLSVTLSARRFLPDGKGGVVEEQVVVGFLRCSAQAATALRSAIDAALLLAQPTAGSPGH